MAVCSSASKDKEFLPRDLVALLKISCRDLVQLGDLVLWREESSKKEIL